METLSKVMLFFSPLYADDLQGKIKNRTEKSRMKRDINKLLSKANVNNKNELIDELTKKIDLFKENYI